MLLDRGIVSGQPMRTIILADGGAHSHHQGCIKVCAVRKTHLSILQLEKPLGSLPPRSEEVPSSRRAQEYINTLVTVKVDTA